MPLTISLCAYNNIILSFYFIKHSIKSSDIKELINILNSSDEYTSKNEILRNNNNVKFVKHKRNNVMFDTEYYQASNCGW